MSHKKLVIVAGLRTPFAKMNTLLREVPPQELGKLVVQELLYQWEGTDWPKLIDEVIFGCVGQPAEAPNIARVISLMAGLPERIPASTVHRNCASGFEAVTTACERAQSNKGEVFVVGGVESMSRYPLKASWTAQKKFMRLGMARSLMQKLLAIFSLRPKDFYKLESALLIGLKDPICGLNMALTAEKVAQEFGITREDQDNFALQSHQRAAFAQKRGRLAREIAKIYPTPKFEAVSEDNGIRHSQSLHALGKLRPVFSRKGSVTAGNASQITDGAAALLLMTAEKAAALGLSPLAKIHSYTYVGCDPSRMGLGPAYAIPKLLDETGIPKEAIDVVEINEAFAAQVLAVQKALDSNSFAEKENLIKIGAFDPCQLNRNGGAIALGHPLAASGARMLLSTAVEMQKRGSEFGLASLCVGGGQGAAVLLEQIS